MTVFLPPYIPSSYILSSNADYVWTCTGTFAVVSLMTGTVVEQLVPTPPDLNCSSPEVAELEDQRIGVASAIAFLSGMMMVRKDLMYLTIIYTCDVLKTELICVFCLILLNLIVLWNAHVTCYYGFRFPALYVWSSVGFPLHIPIRAYC